MGVRARYQCFFFFLLVVALVAASTEVGSAEVELAAGLLAGSVDGVDGDRFWISALCAEDGGALVVAVLGAL
jgi:hypothetical protein